MTTPVFSRAKRQYQLRGHKWCIRYIIHQKHISLVCCELRFVHTRCVARCGAARCRTTTRVVNLCWRMLKYMHENGKRRWRVWQYFCCCNSVHVHKLFLCCSIGSSSPCGMWRLAASCVMLRQNDAICCAAPQRNASGVNEPLHLWTHSCTQQPLARGGSRWRG